jgi:hypothetical protein
MKAKPESSGKRTARAFNARPRLAIVHAKPAAPPRRTASDDAALLDAWLARGKRLKPPNRRP